MRKLIASATLAFLLTAGQNYLHAQVLLDAHSSSAGDSTWSITTTHANELILISTGACCSVLDTTSGTVTVNGNNAKYISGIVCDGFFPAYIWAYVAPTVGTYSLACSEKGLNDVFYFNFAISVYQPSSTLGFSNIIVGDSAANVGVDTISAGITTTQNNSLVYGLIVFNDNGATGKLNWNGGLTELDHYYISNGVDGGHADSTMALAGTYTIKVTDTGATQPYAALTLVAVQPNTTTGTNLVKGETSKVNIYPNPSNGQFAITFSHPELVSPESSGQTIEIDNVLGEKVYSDIVHGSSFIVDLSNQPNGIYFYRVLNNNGNVLGEGKLEIQK